MQLVRAFVLVNLLATLAGGVPCASAAGGTDDVLIIKKAIIGFGGKFKAGFWQPVRVTVVAGAAGARGRLELVVPDGDQMPVVYRDSNRGPLELRADPAQTGLLYVKSGTTEAPRGVRLIDAGG